MRVLPFRSQAVRPPPVWRVRLEKDGRTRLFEMRAAGVPGVLQTWVRFDGQPHRAKIVRTAVEREQMRQQFEREIAELERDGWTRLPDA